MKTIHLLIGVAVGCLLATAVFAQPSRTKGQTNILADIAAQYDALERNIEAQNAKLARQIKGNIESLEAKIKSLEQRAAALRESIERLEAAQNVTNPVAAAENATKVAKLNIELRTITEEIAKAKDEIKALKAQLAQLERDKEKAIAQLRQQRAKAIKQVEKQLEESARR